MQDYIDFHGMLCVPSVASKCIDSFNGKILFMPRDYKSKGIDRYCYSRISLIDYYTLVVYSLTGLSTLLNMTSLSHAEESMEGIK